MTPEETLAYEARSRSRRVVLAAVAGVALLAAAIITLSGPHAKVDEATLDLLVAYQRYPLDLIASVINAVAFIAVAWTLVELLRSAGARSERPQKWVRWVAILGGVLAGVGGVVYAIIFAHAVHVFATTGQQTYEQATHLTGGGALIALQLVDLAAALLIALAFVLVSVQAMNQGLLSKFMGYLGMLAGALVLFQITQVPIVQCYWLFALAYLTSGRWPTGVPPAWRTGRTEAWPSSAEMRTRRAAEAAARGGGARGGGARGGGARGGRAGAAAGASGRSGGGGLFGAGGMFGGGSGGLFGGRGRTAAPAPAAPTPQPGGTPGEARTRSNTPKRKRKRRN